jgi:predicted nucleic acid-binding Zn finger protein
MIIKTKGQLLYEIIKIKNAVKSQNRNNIENYYNDYINQLKVPSKDIFRTGPYILISEEVSYHLLSTYLLLDLIDFHYNGRKFINTDNESTPALLRTLETETNKIFKNIEKIKSILTEVNRITNHQLHIFLLPIESNNDYILESTYPGNILILFPSNNENYSNGEYDGRDEMENVYRGIGEFYLDKQLRGQLPKWAANKELFLLEFIKWCKDIPSRITMKK